MNLSKAVLSAFTAFFALSACSEPAPGGATTAETTTTAATPAAAPVAPAVAPVAQPAPPLEIATSASPAAQAIDQAAWSARPASPQAARDVLIRVQVLLDRAHFAPGVIDGQAGGNLSAAIAAFEAAQGLPADGKMDADAWAALTRDARPVMTDYVITEADVKGPFIAEVPKEYEDMAKLPAMSFTSPAEALAEKFHMDEALLRTLNPGADFATPGEKIVVAAFSTEDLPAKVERIEVDKQKRQVRAYDAADELVAVYPATVGSTERPAPAGEWAVRTLAPNPTYTFDPARLTFGKKSMGKLTIKAGPNNPVGSTWIDLTKDTYGIHGAPDPKLVGKVASHGCVRLTNWDAAQLGRAVKPGTKVVFLGADQPAPRGKTVL